MTKDQAGDDDEEEEEEEEENPKPNKKASPRKHWPRRRFV
jgi:hypothetical protein